MSDATPYHARLNKYHVRHMIYFLITSHRKWTRKWTTQQAKCNNCCIS